MPDFAKERSGIEFGREVRAPQDVGRPEVAAPLFSVRVLSRSRLDDATRVLDGIGGLGWSVIGFVVGAVFWHFIGFWGFVADVVLAGGPPTATERVVWSAPGGQLPKAGTAVAKTGSTASSQPACTVLVLDRRSGATTARPCTGVLPVLPADSFQGREDRVAVAD